MTGEKWIDGRGTGIGTHDRTPAQRAADMREAAEEQANDALARAVNRLGKAWREERQRITKLETRLAELEAELKEQNAQICVNAELANQNQDTCVDNGAAIERLEAQAKRMRALHD